MSASRRRHFTEGPGKEDDDGAAEPSKPAPVRNPFGMGYYKTDIWDQCFVTGKAFKPGDVRTPLFIQVQYTDEDEHDEPVLWSNLIVRFVRPGISIPYDHRLKMMLCAQRCAIDLHQQSGGAAIVDVRASETLPDDIHNSHWGHCFIENPRCTDTVTTLGACFPLFVDVLFEDNTCTRALRFISTDYADYATTVFDAAVIDISGPDIEDAAPGVKVRQARAYMDGTRCEYQPCFMTACACLP